VIVRILATAVICGLLSGPSFAEYYTGNDLLRLCSGGSEGVCLGYVMGVADMMDGGRATALGARACVPAGVIGKQLEDAVVSHLQRFVSLRQLPADLLVAGALAQTFPCR
jgi:hypothetical protein